MPNLITSNLMAPITDYPEHLVPAIRQVADILGIKLPEPQIRAVIISPYAPCEPYTIVVRHIAKRLYHIFSSNSTSKGTAFRLNAAILCEEVRPLDWQRENSFYYDEVLTQECRSLVSELITETSNFPLLLAPLIHYKEFGFQFRHAPALLAGLLLIITRCLVMASPAARHHLDELLRTLIYSPPAWLFDELNCFLMRITRAEAEDGN